MVDEFFDSQEREIRERRTLFDIQRHAQGAENVHAFPRIPQRHQTRETFDGVSKSGILQCLPATHSIQCYIPSIRVR